MSCYYPQRIPTKLVDIFYPGCISKLPPSWKSQRICLSFDDGPHEPGTRELLDMLRAADVKAVFFLLGENIGRYPDLAESIRKEGHLIGSHGIKHLDGWRTSNKEYQKNLYSRMGNSPIKYYRPPFGRLRISQYFRIKQEFKVVFWTLMPGDFDEGVSAKDLQQRICSARSGDILVMHDHSMSDPSIRHALYNSILSLKKRGFEFTTVLE